MPSNYIMSSVEYCEIRPGEWKYLATWWVGTQYGKAEFDSEEDAWDYVKSSINRAIGF